MLAPEPLRAAALEILGPSGDERARDALGRGVLGIEPSVARWEGSHGLVHAHRVLLGLSARGLAEFDRAPGVGDAVCAAMAAAVAAQPGNAMAELRAYWALGDASAAGEGMAYRGAPARDAQRDDPDAVRSALVEFLRATGEREASAHAARARVSLGKGRVRLAWSRADWHGFRLDPAWAARIEHAARVLLAGPTGESVRVVMEPG